MASESPESNPLFDQSIPPWKKELLLRKKLVGKGRGVWSVQLTSKYGAEDFHSSVRNMKLIRPQESGDYILNSTVLFSDSKTKMVEERVPKRHSSKAMNKLRVDYLNSIKNIDLNGKEDGDSNSDSSEELQYGPGIVNKLKSKYLSMTLRDNQRYSSRPSLANLRRATSLENMLDDDSPRGAQTKPHFIKKQCNANLQKTNKLSLHHAKYLGISKGESMKRARSMDTLFRSEAKSVRPNGMTQSVIANEDLVIVDRDTEFAVSKSCIQDDKELPPPDVVKQTKKIFEKTTDSNVTSDKRNKKTVLNKVSNNVKVATVFEKQMDRTKPQLSPKPTFSGDNKNQAWGNNWPNKRLYPVVTSAKAQPNPSLIKVVPPRTVSRPSPEVCPPSPGGPRVVGSEPKPVLSCSSGVRPPLISVKPNQSGENISPLLSPVRGSPLLSPVRSSPVHLKCDEDGDRSPESPSKERGSPVAKFYAENSLSSCFPRRNLMQATNPCLIKSQTLETTSVKQVAIIRPIPAKKPLTDQEVENNLINTVRSIKKIINDNSDGNVDSEQVQSWEKKSWQNPNTMVFNFSSRPTVPDYIENDGLNITSRIAPKPPTNKEEIDGEEEWEAPSSFCDVSFIGDNVLINGKSSMRKEPNPNKVPIRKIKFNDEATTLYEYPSEDSLIIEDPSPPEPAPLKSTTTTTLPPSPLGGATLSRYTPSKSPTPSGFELGVTSTASVLPHTQHSIQHQNQSDEYLKPVDIDQEMAWSQETASDILF